MILSPTDQSVLLWIQVHGSEHDGGDKFPILQATLWRGHMGPVKKLLPIHHCICHSPLVVTCKLFGS